jgi:hypothetical protein
MRPMVLLGRPHAAAHAGRQPVPQPVRRLAHARRPPSRNARGNSGPADGDLRHAGVTPARGRRGGDAAHKKRCSPAMPRRWRRGRVGGWRRWRSDTRGPATPRQKGGGEVSGGRRRSEGGGTTAYPAEAAKATAASGP